MEASNPADTFLIEAAELLDNVEETVLGIEKRPDDTEAVNRLFRAFHTIKGSGAMFGFDAVAEFTHHVESVLDQLRQNRISVSPRLVELILAARDHIQQLLAPAGAVAAATDAASARLACEFQALLVPHVAPAEPSRPRQGVTPLTTAKTKYTIHFRPNPVIAATGLDPATLLEELRSLGACHILADVGGIPPLAKLQPTKCWLGWEILLTTDRDTNAIRDVFIFAEDGSELRVELVSDRPLGADVTGKPAVGLDHHGVAAASANEMRSSGRAAEPETPPLPTKSPRLAGETESPGPHEERPAPDVGAAVKAVREGVVRVPSAKLDHIVNLVGELVMNESRLSQVASRLNVGELAAPVEAIERLIAEMRDAVLGIRMMPIGSTFNRFKRLVHDLSRDLGKEVELVTAGAETELDKTVLDQLADPLVHLIRNSIDHGICPPAERVAMGKPARGTVRLSASHQGSHVVVTIQDDGRGLDTEAIRTKAIEKQLVSADANLTEAEIFNLVFLPGFSTAKSVTGVSGRGVGMDVVRKQIDALRGSIQLASTRGHGTTIALSLPLTLAIIEGLLVTIGDDPFIIPMSVVTENVELRREDRARNNGRNLISVRGELIPYLHLRELFGIPGDEPAIEKIVIVRYGRDRVGLVVDRVLGNHQTVIQSLGRMFRPIGVLSGGTILGDGRVALILDLTGVVAFADSCAGARDTTPGPMTAAVA